MFGSSRNVCVHRKGSCIYMSSALYNFNFATLFCLHSALVPPMQNKQWKDLDVNNIAFVLHNQPYNYSTQKDARESFDLNINRVFLSVLCTDQSPEHQFFFFNLVSEEETVAFY
jgi:hypothetical protein